MCKKRPRGAQKWPTDAPDVPTPSQMEPKTIPNPIFKRFCILCFPTPKLHRFFIDCLWLLCNFSKLEPWILCAQPVFCGDFRKIDVFEKYAKKARCGFVLGGQNDQKWFQNCKKLLKIVPKSPKDAQDASKSEKNRKTCEKWANMSQLEAPSPKTIRSRRDTRTPTILRKERHMSCNKTKLSL